MTAINFEFSPESVRDAVRLANALRDGDSYPLEGLVARATADPGYFLGGAVMLLLTVRENGRDPGLILHERASVVVSALESRDLIDGGDEL